MLDMKEREYLKELGKKITDSSVRKEIVNEYEAHIEDCKAALMESGMTEVEAEEEAVRQMGDPQEAGEAMDKIYHKVFDSNMFLWMLALGCVPIVCVCISYLIARDPNAFLWVWNEALGLNCCLWNRIELLGEIHRQSFILCSRKRLGAGMLRCKQRAGTFYLGIMFCSEFPGQAICRNPLLCIDSMSAEYGTERIYESFAEQKRDQTFMGDWNGRYQNQLEGKRISVWTSYESKSTGI